MAAKLAVHYLLVSVQLIDGRAIMLETKTREIGTATLLRSRVCYNPLDFLSLAESSMASLAPLLSRIRFGAFDLDAASGELRKCGIPIKLRRQAIDVLIMLTNRAGGPTYRLPDKSGVDESASYHVLEMMAAQGKLSATELARAVATPIGARAPTP